VDTGKIAVSVNKFRVTVFRVALGYVRNIHDAEDITQDVFLKLMKLRKDFVTEEAEKAWLIRVTINRAKDFLKSAWFKNRAEISENDQSLKYPNFADGADLELYGYVKGLKPKYRTVIYLHYYEEYSAKEIAKILAKPVSTVETQLQRARGQLKQTIVKEGTYHEKWLQGNV